MRTTSGSSVQYSPNDPPADPAQLQRYLREEMAKISAAVGALAIGHIDKTHTAPPKPRDGDLRYAAGAPDWNPGAGKGLYLHNGSIWTLIKAIP